MCCPLVSVQWWNEVPSFGIAVISIVEPSRKGEEVGLETTVPNPSAVRVILYSGGGSLSNTAVMVASAVTTSWVELFVILVNSFCPLESVQVIKNHPGFALECTLIVVPSWKYPPVVAPPWPLTVPPVPAWTDIEYSAGGAISSSVSPPS